MRKTTVLVAMFVLISSMASSQLEYAKEELYNINKVFDSSYFLGFDVTMTYHSDTIYGKFAHERLDGRFVTNSNKFYYRVGENEYVQNDSFVFDIDHQSKVMIMTKGSNVPQSNFFAIRQFVDSILTWYDTAYIITVQTIDNQRAILFNARYDSIPYQFFAIYYDSTSYYPSRYDIEFASDPGEEDSVFLTSDTTDATTFMRGPIKRRITMRFSNYFISFETGMFASEEYVYFDKTTNRYIPADKYREYRFYTNNVYTNPDDVAQEIFPPPEEDPE